MLRFLKCIFSARKIQSLIVFIYTIIFTSVLFICGYHLFYSIDWLSVFKYSWLIILSCFALYGLVQYEDKRKEDKEK